jgi:crotonobetainyl-CoA:carnitine CoA-transferase CaiB-like acyl-CoA transferase
MLPLPLYGLRVADLTAGAAAPYAAAVLGDLGAEVIRLAGDPMADQARLNRNKLGCSIDPSRAAGRDLCLRLVSLADAVIQVGGSAAFSFAVLRERRPDVILVTLTSGDDPTLAAAAAGALIAALFHRRATGEGQEVVVGSGAVEAVDAPPAAPRGVYATASVGGGLALDARSDGEFAALCDRMGRPELATDPRFGDRLARQRNRADLDATIEAWTRGHSATALAAALVAAGVPAFAVQTPDQLVEDRHLRARGFFEAVARAGAGVEALPALPYRFGRTPAHVRLPAPAPGEHDAYVLGDLLGLSEAEIEALRAIGAIGDR